MSFIDYYELLQVSPKAHVEIIKSAYRTMMSKLNNHPDKGGDEEKAKNLNEAYEILANEEKRKMYDQFYFNISRNSNSNIDENKSSSLNSKINIIESQTISGHTRAIDKVSVGNFNSIIASCQNSGIVDSFFGLLSQENYNTQVRIWNINNGKELSIWPVGDSSVKILKVSCNSNSVAVGTNSFISVCDINTQSIIYSLKLDGTSFGGVAFNDDLKTLFLGVPSGIEVINISTNELITRLPHSNLQVCIKISSNGYYLVANPQQNKFLHVWDVKNKRKIRSILNPAPIISEYSVNDTGELLAVSNKRDAVFLYNITTGEKLHTIYNQIETLQFSSNNKYFILGDRFGVVRIFNSHSFDELATFKAHIQEITSLCFTSDCTKIITGSKDQLIKVWDII